MLEIKTLIPCKLMITQQYWRTRIFLYSLSEVNIIPNQCLVQLYCLVFTSLQLLNYADLRTLVLESIVLLLVGTEVDFNCNFVSSTVLSRIVHLTQILMNLNSYFYGPCPFGCSLLLRLHQKVAANKKSISHNHAMMLWKIPPEF